MPQYSPRPPNSKKPLSKTADGAIMSRQTSVQRFISNYPRQSPQVEATDSIAFKPSVTSVISARTNLTAGRMVSIDRQADKHNLDRLQDTTLNSVSRNVKYLRMNYDSLKRESDDMEREIRRLQRDLHYLEERQKDQERNEAKDNANLNKMLSELEKKTTYCDEEMYMTGILNHMKKRLVHEAGESDCYGRDIQAEMKRIDKEMLFLNNYLSDAKKELGAANNVRNNLIDELNDGREMRSKRKEGLEIMLIKHRELSEDKRKRAEDMAQLSSRTKLEMEKDRIRKSSRLSLSRKMYKAILHDKLQKQTIEYEPVLNLFTEMMQVTGASTSSEVIQRFINRESTLETVRKTEEELEQRLNKLLKEKKLLESEVNMPLSEDENSMRNIYKLIDTKETDLNKVETISKNVKDNYVKQLLILDGIRHMVPLLIRKVGLNADLSHHGLKNCLNLLGNQVDLMLKNIVSNIYKLVNEDKQNKEKKNKNLPSRAHVVTYKSPSSDNGDEEEEEEENMEEDEMRFHFGSADIEENNNKPMDEGEGEGETIPSEVEEKKPEEEEKPTEVEEEKPVEEETKPVEEKPVEEETKPETEEEKPKEEEEEEKLDLPPLLLHISTDLPKSESHMNEIIPQTPSRIPLHVTNTTEEESKLLPYLLTPSLIQQQELQQQQQQLENNNNNNNNDANAPSAAATTTTTTAATPQVTQPILPRSRVNTPTTRYINSKEQIPPIDTDSLEALKVLHELTENTRMKIKPTNYDVNIRIRANEGSPIVSLYGNEEDINAKEDEDLIMDRDAIKSQYMSFVPDKKKKTRTFTLSSANTDNNKEKKVKKENEERNENEENEENNI